MKRNNPLNVLIEQSQKSRDQAGKILAGSRQNQQQIAAQLAALKRYRLEYSERLANALNKGVGTAILENHRRFISSLDAAIAQSVDSLRQADQRIDNDRNNWRQREKTLSSFNLLSAQRAARNRYRQNKAEQRQTDEFTNNTEARKMSQTTQPR